MMHIYCNQSKFLSPSQFRVVSVHSWIGNVIIRGNNSKSWNMDGNGVDSRQLSFFKYFHHILYYQEYLCCPIHVIFGSEIAIIMKIWDCRLSRSFRSRNGGRNTGNQLNQRKHMFLMPKLFYCMVCYHFEGIYKDLQESYSGSDFRSRNQISDP